MKGIAAMVASGRRLQIATWNIAAINNNPFEYWITYNENPGYEQLMNDVEKFIESPGERDIPVSSVFTNDMFNKLEHRMASTCGWQSVRTYWEEDFKNRKIITEFMKDGLLGSKRLASMPDRITNTINVASKDEPVCRPTVVNMYDGDLSTLDQWYSSWEEFMFDNALEIKTKKGLVESIVPYQMLQPIKRAKYPDITEEEENVSLPLQTMCGAIFDAILVHVMNTVSTPKVWQSLKRAMVENLNKLKVPKTLDILETETYINSDIIGDTNGLATKPVLDAITKAMSSDSKLAGHKLLFGLDANTYEKSKPGKQQDVLDFGKHYVSCGLTSCFGDVPDKKNYTTFNSRTYLQPQLNKACKKSDKRSNGDVNPKDFILFGKDNFSVESTWKDNTGHKKYIEDMAFPTMEFPSDHAILTTIIKPVSSETCEE